MNERNGFGYGAETPGCSGVRRRWLRLSDERKRWSERERARERESEQREERERDSEREKEGESNRDRGEREREREREKEKGDAPAPHCSPTAVASYVCLICMLA
eukprot:Tamp_33489.p1 GENE.Tamp_33489~~Tamp_33489.p1  ORF type:complete len:104 (-),score=4.76 Tamp_33489:169-480(-)